ncbi:cupin domain-containing protein [Bradyrhizobium sp. 2TAF24]|uniref:cupin domain-containing protein n=1 Tax=Bradyrhizobium sp. 2TAF24 TaxID=3233011 RepID=UPI003F91B8EE
MLAPDRRHFNLTAVTSLLAAALALPARPASSADGPAATPSGTASTRRAVIAERLPGPDARLMSLIEITYPPGTGSPEHLHANGVMAFVVAGSIVSRVGDGPERTYGRGEAWWEPPGAIHRVSRNASTSEPATLLAIYVAPADASPADLMKPI